MKRRLLSLALTLSLLGGSVLAITAPETPATAPAPAQGMDQRLAAVTAKVKSALALDTNAYPEFYGNLNEDLLAPAWDLEWSGANGQISVGATEDGKVLRYYNSADQSTVYAGPLAFPPGSREGARAAAEAFIKKLLSSGETVALKNRGSDRLGASTYYFNGEIRINGLSAGLSCNVSVNCADNKVVSFSRESLEGNVMGGVPSAAAKAGTEAARDALRQPLKLRLEYELKEQDGKLAVLRYLPEPIDDYYADAADGRLVNLTELYQSIDEDGGSPYNLTAEAPAAEAEEAAADAAGGLTDAEQAGAAKLEGVLGKDALDQKARAIPALGLDAYRLSTANYQVSREEDNKVSAILRYGRQVEGSSWRRTITLDARTGALEAVSSSRWLDEDSGASLKTSAAAAQQTAESFLKSQCPGPFAASVLYDSTSAEANKWQGFHSFHYVQKANGYLFPGNRLYVGIDATDGSISSYRKDYDEAVTFGSAEGILTMDQAVDAWLATYDVTLQYVRVPTAVDYSQPEFEPLADLGIRYLHKLVLGYRLERDDYLSGIDAKTGEPVIPYWRSDDGVLLYQDVSGHWAEKAITDLARYGVGYQGGKFEPNKRLTQLDLIALIMSCNGWRYDPKDGADHLYEGAYSYGLLKRGERNDSLAMTRSGAIRMLLDGWGFGTAAKLQGIYKTSYTDDKSIPAADYGYAAIAQGLGLASNAAYEPQGAITRAQAAVMLYRLLDR